jgi:hypothetical protein
MRSIAITERMGSKVYGANTLPELADILGYAGKAKEAFLASIVHYNELCEKSVDSDFGNQDDVMIPIKRASSSPRRRQPQSRWRGLVTDNDFKVLNKKDEGIRASMLWATASSAVTPTPTRLLSRAIPSTWPRQTACSPGDWPRRSRPALLTVKSG